MFSQIEKVIQYKVAMIQNFVHKEEQGETAFWQTKGQITYKIVNYTDEQNPLFKDLFIKQYQEILPIYKRMVVSEDEKDTSLFIKTLIKQEEEYRNLLTKEQLELYSKALIEFKNNDEQNYLSYMSLFFSDELLAEFKSKFL
jgi:hypothetical protein